VIVCDVLEHVPDVTQVEREIVRILKKGGHFLQTLPLDIFAEHDVVLARLGQNGIEHLTDQPEYHIDNFHPEQGALVFRRFSYADIHQRFSSLGCEHRAYSFASRQLGIIGINPPVHIVRKIESVV
jgi:SAM-dependent methyltransferase